MWDLYGYMRTKNVHNTEELGQNFLKEVEFVLSLLLCIAVEASL